MKENTEDRGKYRKKEGHRMKNKKGKDETIRKTSEPLVCLILSTYFWMGIL